VKKYDTVTLFYYALHKL